MPMTRKDSESRSAWRYIFCCRPQYYFRMKPTCFGGKQVIRAGFVERCAFRNTVGYTVRNTVQEQNRHMNQKHCLLVMALAGVLSLVPLPAFREI